jgi:tripartite-type tricarboxylate transporter receptor subunit TctC
MAASEGWTDISSKEGGAVRLLSLLAMLVLASGACAQAYPVKPIKFVSPQPPGGTFDYAMRVFAEPLGPALGQPLIIEHRAGAGTVVGLDYTAKQAPDGYTIVMSSSTHAVLPSVYTKLPFDPVKAFDPISMVGAGAFVLVVRSDLPVKSVADYIALAKAKPGFISFGSSGVGTPLHFAGEMLKAMENLDMLHVPYKGAAPVMQAILAGDIVSSFAPGTLAIPHLKSGKFRAIGNVGTVRSAAFPDLPNIGETVPGFGIDSWFGVMGPAGMPRPIVERLNTEFNRVARDPQFIRDKLVPAGIDPGGTTPERLREMLVADIAKFARIVKSAGIKPE